MGCADGIGGFFPQPAVKPGAPVDSQAENQPFELCIAAFDSPLFNQIQQILLQGAEVGVLGCGVFQLVPFHAG